MIAATVDTVHDVPKAQVTATPRVPDAPHGTLRGWSMGCRCMFCQSAKNATTVTVSGGGTREMRTR